MTWGRIQHTVEPEHLEQVVMQTASKFVGPEAASARVCLTLQDARDAPYFFESLIDFGQKRIPSGRRRKRWRRGIDRAMREGKEIYYLGDPTVDWYLRDRNTPDQAS